MPSRSQTWSSRTSSNDPTRSSPLWDVDAGFGKLMAGLDGLGLGDDTIVVVWGDHGWKLGEHNGWGKQTNYNIDTRVPLIVRWPRSRLKGARSDRLVELVDLHPTLCDLAGIDIPPGLEGTSFQPLFRDPGLECKSAAFSQYHRRPNVSPDGRRYMGYSMVTERYHYVEWRRWDNDMKLAGGVAAVELYDSRSDPDENHNIAGLPENASIVEELAAKLRSGWRAARPDYT